MPNSNACSVNPYLTFNGNCKEAMTFYKEALNGELEILTFEESPVDVPEDDKQKTMHATLRFGNAVIMASDSLPGSRANFGNGCHVSIACSDVEEAERFFNNLSRGGHVTLPFAETFREAKFGMLVDPFGLSWMVNCPIKKAEA